MCNRYRMTAKQAELARRYGVERIYPGDATLPPPKLYPDQPAWVVRAEGRCTLDVIRWGFPAQAAQVEVIDHAVEISVPAAIPFTSGDTLALGQYGRQDSVLVSISIAPKAANFE